MRVFTATLATETNTFAPMPTGLAGFKERGYYKAGQHPDHLAWRVGNAELERLAADGDGQPVPDEVRP